MVSQTVCDEQKEQFFYEAYTEAKALRGSDSEE
jgi:hypothetical protein